MRIGVYASARNEMTNLDAWCDCTKDADVRIVNDTGSSDDTVNGFRERSVPCTQIPIEPMYLCNALNTVMDLLPEDLDLIIRVDLDERLPDGWRDHLERLHLNGPTVVRVWFDHGGCEYRHTRIHTRHGFRWELPVHEVLVGPAGTRFVDVPMVIEHHQDFTKDRSQVLGELQAALEADPNNERLQHYLAREYTYRADWQSAIPLFQKHVGTGAFVEERSESWRMLGDCYVALMPPEDVPLRPYRQAARIAPERREGWVALADLCHKQGRWLECLEAAERALTITKKNWHFNHPFAWGALPYHLAALASWNLGDLDSAARYGKHALDLEPDNDLYRTNLDWYVAA